MDFHIVKNKTVRNNCYKLLSTEEIVPDKMIADGR